jgi:hypothetical protein
MWVVHTDVSKHHTALTFRVTQAAKQCVLGLLDSKDEDAVYLRGLETQQQSCNLYLSFQSRDFLDCHILGFNTV